MRGADPSSVWRSSKISKESKPEAPSEEGKEEEEEEEGQDMRTEGQNEGRFWTEKGQ